jgi:hypothetical protein
VIADEIIKDIRSEDKLKALENVSEKVLEEEKISLMRSLAKW